MHDPPWFDVHCKEKRRLFRTAVQDSQAVHACNFAKKESRAQTRRAKRVYTQCQKVAFLDKLFNKNPELHAILRQPKCTQPTQPAWNAYHNRHFRPPAAKVCNREVWGWGVAYQLETWRCRLDVPPPPRSSATTRCSE